MIARFVLMVGFVVSVAIAGVAQDESKVAARAEVNAGVQAFRQAHYEEAIDHFTLAVSADPQLTVARMYLATTYLQMFQPGVNTPENVVWATKALDQYSEILRTNPSDINSVKGIAYLKFELNDFDQAKESYAKAIALDPNDPELFYGAAVVNWSIAKRQITAEKAKLDAESDYSLIMSEVCTDVRAMSLSSIDSGIAFLNKAISLRKDYVDAMAYMNQFYRLRAELECGNKKAYKADLKQSDEWSDRAAAARKKKTDAATQDDQEKVPDKPQL